MKDFVFVAKARRAYKPFVASRPNDLEISWQFQANCTAAWLVMNFLREPEIFMSLRDGGADLRRGHAIGVGMGSNHESARFGR